MLKIIDNIKGAVTILSIVAAMWFSYSSHFKGQEIDRLNTNLHSVTTQYEDEKGRRVTETTELRFTNDELKAIGKKKDKDLSRAEKTIKEVSNEIADLRIKANNVETYNKVLLESRLDSIVTKPIYIENKLTAIEPIKTDHLHLTFKVKEGEILVNHLYTAKIITVVDRDRDKITKKGNKRFFMARWVNPRWQYKAKTVSDDPNAVIEDSVYINFQRRKGKRI